MPHDLNCKLLKEGDRVVIGAVVETIQMGEEACNCTVVLDHPMFKGQPYKLTLNTHQVEKVDQDADTEELPAVPEAGTPAESPAETGASDPEEV